MMGKIQPDVVLLDLRMPGEDGFHVMNEARKKQFTSLFIVLTGAGGVKSAVKAVKEGAVDYICKPFEIEDVKLRIDMALESAQLMRKSGNIENKPDTSDKS